MSDNEVIITGLPPGWSMEELISEVEACMFGMSNTGICMGCGGSQGSTEPDAQGYHCESCGEDKVCGTEHIFICIAP